MTNSAADDPGSSGEMTPEEWREKIGRHVERRRLDLGFPSIRAAAAATEEDDSRVSEGAWRPVESGRRSTVQGEKVANPSMATIMGVAGVLAWPADFIDRLRAGESPERLSLLAEAGTEFSKARHPSLDGANIGVQVYGARGTIKVLQAELHEVFERLDRLEPTVAAHERQLAVLGSVPEKLDEVLRSLTGRGASEAAAPPPLRTAPTVPRARPRTPRASGGAGQSP